MRRKLQDELLAPIWQAVQEGPQWQGETELEVRGPAAKQRDARQQRRLPLCPTPLHSPTRLSGSNLSVSRDICRQEATSRYSSEHRMSFSVVTQ